MVTCPIASYALFLIANQLVNLVAALVKGQEALKDQIASSTALLQQVHLYNAVVNLLFYRSNLLSKKI
jgi:hypothetical protein